MGDRIVMPPALLYRTAGHHPFQSLARGVSPEELLAAAAMLELPALGIVERNSVTGIICAWDAQRATGVRAIAGCRLDLADGIGSLVYPTDRAA